MTTPVRREWGVACIVAALLCAFGVGWGGLPRISDETGYLPMAHDAADPGLYSTNDLLLATGRLGPFFMYRAAGVLYATPHAVDVWWFAIYLVALFGSFVALWWIARAVGASTVTATIATATIAVANPFRGTIHWFLIPPPNLVISTLALPAVLAALALALAGRRGWGLLVASATFNLHPSMGLLTAAAIAALMAWDRVTGAPDALPIPVIARWWSAALVLALPTALFVATSTPGNFAVPDGATFRRVFDLYSWHVAPADHWREGYGFFLLAVGAAALLVDTRRLRDAAILAAAFLVMIAIGFINRLTVQVATIDLLFLVRVAPYVKTLAWIAIAAAVAGEWRRATAGRRRLVGAAAALLLMAALGKNAGIAEGVLALACATVLVLRVPRMDVTTWAMSGLLVVAGLVAVAAEGWQHLGLPRFTDAHLDDVRLLMIAVGVLWSAWTSVRAARAEHASDDGARDATASVRVALLPVVGVCAIELLLQAHPRAFVPSSAAAVRERIRIGVPDSSIAALTAWARTTPRGALFAVPPVDARFDAFRLAAERGVYILVEDVVYVLYDAARTGEAHARVLRTGVRVRGRHQFDESPYHTLAPDSVDALARRGVDFAVFGAPARLTRPLDRAVAYQDSQWIVYDLRSRR